MMERFGRLLDESAPEEMALNMFQESMKSVRRVLSTDINLESRVKAANCYGLQMALEIWPNEPYEVERFMKKLLEVIEIYSNGIVGGA
jgi:hypothetical protein